VHNVVRRCLFLARASRAIMSKITVAAASAVTCSRASPETGDARQGRSPFSSCGFQPVEHRPNAQRPSAVY
jgi:hypothetical protein